MIKTQLYVNNNVPEAQRLFQQFEQKITTGSRIEIAKFLDPQVDRYQTQQLYRQGGYETGVSHPVPSFSPDVNKTLDSAAAKYGLDPGMIRTFAKIESGGNPDARTGSYKGLLQTRSGDVDSAVSEIAQQARDFKRDFGRDPDATDLYMIHQQGAGGYANHLAFPNRPAWENMASTAEGRQKGEGWARAAIWGNIPDNDKRRFGSVDNVTSEAFVNLWRNRVANSGGGARELTDEDTPVGFTMSKAEALRRAEQQSVGMPQNIRDGLVRMVEHRFSLVQAQNSEQRSEAAASATDAIKAASVGNEGVAFPEDAVRRFLPDKYEQLRSNFDISQHVGSQLRAARYASGDELQDIARDLGSGQGWRSDQLRDKIKMSGAIDPDGEYNRWKAHAISALREIAGQRQKGLESDPAGYVSGSPEVQAKIKALDAVPEKDEAGRLKASQAIRDAAWKKQGEMGVPESQRRILTAGEAQGRVSALMDPTKTPDALKSIQQLRASYGPQWQYAFRDMVQLGGLPTGFQSITSLDEANADLLSRALRENIGKEGKEASSWAKLLGQTADQASRHSNKAVIDAAIDADGKVKQYQKSLIAQGVPAESVDSHIKDIKTLAYAHAYYQGADTATAPQTAIKAFLDKIEFFSRARVPGEDGAAVKSATTEIASAMSAHNLTIPRAYALFPSVGNASDYASHSSAALSWVNSEDGTGVYALDHNNRIMRWKDGNRVEVKFADPNGWRASAGVPVSEDKRWQQATAPNPEAEKFKEDLNTFLHGTRKLNFRGTTQADLDSAKLDHLWTDKTIEVNWDTIKHFLNSLPDSRDYGFHKDDR